VGEREDVMLALIASLQVDREGGRFGAGKHVAANMLTKTLGTSVVCGHANSPFQFRILDVQVLIATTVNTSTIQLRSATGGGGTPTQASFSAAGAIDLLCNSTSAQFTAWVQNVVFYRNNKRPAGA
jgi:hypothetical protein